MLQAIQKKATGRTVKCIQYKSYQQLIKSINQGYQFVYTQFKSQFIISLKWKLFSQNSFPTGAGLASSASGLSCLAYIFSYLYGISSETQQQLESVSHFARLGSGSACRSIFGGIVLWDKGFVKNFEQQTKGLEQIDISQKSKATQIKSQQYWPELRVRIVILSSKFKDTPSTAGMQQTVQTCQFFNQRKNIIAPKRLKKIIEAIQQKNFQSLAEITIKQSNQLHAMCLDTYPSIIYMNEESQKLIDRINKINYNQKHNEQQKQTRIKIAYTMDAGTNVFLIYQTKDQHIVDQLTMEYDKIINCVVGLGTQSLNMKQLIQLYQHFTKLQ